MNKLIIDTRYVHGIVGTSEPKEDAIPTYGPAVLIRDGGNAVVLSSTGQLYEGPVLQGDRVEPNYGEFWEVDEAEDDAIRHAAQIIDPNLFGQPEETEHTVTFKAPTP